MESFENILADLKISIIEMAKTQWVNYKDAVISDGEAFLISIKDDLQRWTKQMASGEISPKDFQFLLNGKKDLAEMKALTNIGLAKAAIDKFTNDLFNLVITKTIAAI